MADARPTPRACEHTLSPTSVSALSVRSDGQSVGQAGGWPRSPADVVCDARPGPHVRFQLASENFQAPCSQQNHAMLHCVCSVDAGNVMMTPSDCRKQASKRGREGGREAAWLRAVIRRHCVARAANGTVRWRTHRQAGRQAGRQAVKQRHSQQHNIITHCHHERTNERTNGDFRLSDENTTVRYCITVLGINETVGLKVRRSDR